MLNVVLINSLAIGSAGNFFILESVEFSCCKKNILSTGVFKSHISPVAWGLNSTGIFAGYTEYYKIQKNQAFSV